MSERLNANIKATAAYYSGTGYWEQLTAQNGGAVSLTALSALESQGVIDIIRDGVGNIVQIVKGVVQTVEPESGGIYSSANASKINIPAAATAVSGGYSLASGLAGAANFVTTQVSPAVMAASVGIMLGQAIDWTLYNLAPDFWDSHNMSELNPETWGQIADENSLFNMVFLINSATGTVQPYASEKAIAYMAAYMSKKLVFDKYDAITEIPSGVSTFDRPELNVSKNYAHVQFSAVRFQPAGYTQSIASGNSPVYMMNIADFTSGGHYTYFAVSQSPFTVTEKTVNTAGTSTNTRNGMQCSFNNQTFYVCSGAQVMAGTLESAWVALSTCYLAGSSVMFHMETLSQNNVTNNMKEMGYLILNAIKHHMGGVAGIEEAPNTTQPIGLNLDIGVEEALQTLKEQFPAWLGEENAKTVSVPDDTGGLTLTKTYYPTAYPGSLNPTTEQYPTTYTLPNSTTQARPYVNANDLAADLDKSIAMATGAEIDETDIPNGGTGFSPAISTPIGGGGSALFTAYNPTQAQINSLGAYMWSENFITQLLKLFNDPMQAIIGLHKVYMTPQTTTAQNIKIGYLNSGVSANVVSDQYTVMDCGTVNIPEYYGNTLDYAPNTKISLYLPFIGIVDLDTADIMRSRVGVRYSGDVLSGACLAEVSVYRDGVGGVLYEYSGTMSVTYPLSSGSYMGMVSGALGLALSVGGAIASGGVTVPAVGGSISSVMTSHTNVQHSGSLSGNSGVMGGKKPYIIISRAQHAMANNYRTLTGDATNYTTTLSEGSGFTRVSELHLDGIPATTPELDEIEAILKSGVIV